MISRRNWVHGWVALIVLSFLSSACEPDATAPSGQPVMKTTGQASERMAAASMNGAAGQMPAFYDGQLFTVNMKEELGNASASLIAKNSSINEIYASNDLDEEQDFVPVIDAIQGDGFNPLWRQNLIVFNQGLPRTSSSRMTRSWPLQRARILRYPSSRLTKCIAVRLWAGNSRGTEPPPSTYARPRLIPTPSC
jgi:hypothetical protein